MKLLWDQDPDRAKFAGIGDHWKTGPVAYGALLRPDTLSDVSADRKLSIATLAGDEENCYEHVAYHGMRSEWTHGAAVMDIACGWPNPLRPELDTRDAAAEADIIFVQLPRATVADTSGGSMDVHVLDALIFILQHTVEADNVVVNLSFGTFAGPHDGTSFLERAIDELCEQNRRLQVLLPAGNSYNDACHAVLDLTADKKNGSLGLEVPADSPRDTIVELWWSGNVPVRVSLTAPDGSIFSVADANASAWADATVEREGYGCCIVQKSGLPGPSAGVKNSMTLLAIAPTLDAGGKRHAAPYGRWSIRVEADSAVKVDAWVERGDSVSGVGFGSTQPRFAVDVTENPRDEYPLNQPVRKAGTLNSFATGRKPVVVGSQTALPILRVSSYSSAGPGRNDVRAFGPDCTVVTDNSDELPGLLVMGARGTSAQRLTGTSLAAPQVARRLLNRQSPCEPPAVSLSLSDNSTGLPRRSVDYSEIDFASLAQRA